MINIKTDKDILIMSKACQIAGLALLRAKEVIKQGITTKEVDDEIRCFIESKGAKPSFLGYHGFPASSCISINDEVIHGIPNDYKIKNGDIVSVDVGAYYDGFHGDNAYTFAVGEVSSEDRILLDKTESSLYKAIEVCLQGNRIGDISNAVQSYVEQFGLSVVRQYVGHGIGRNLHEEPEVPNFGTKGRGTRLVKGMVIAIEPMVNFGTEDIKVANDGWTVSTFDGKKSAHFEHTVLITGQKPIILTKVV